MLNVSDLSFNYPDKTLIRDLSFSLNTGHVLHVTGPNGAGKTTLLKLIAGILIPLSGEVQYDGEISYIGHQHGVNLYLTPREYLEFDLGVASIDAQDQYLRHFELEQVADKPAGLLSDGQKRRLSLLRLQTEAATLWLLDEPLVGLDPKGMSLLGDLMHTKLSENGAIIFISHQVLPFALPYIEVLSL